MYVKSLMVIVFTLYVLVMGWLTWNKATHAIETRRAAECHTALIASLPLCGK